MSRCMRIERRRGRLWLLCSCKWCFELELSDSKSRFNHIRFPYSSMFRVWMWSHDKGVKEENWHSSLLGWNEFVATTIGSVCCQRGVCVVCISDNTCLVVRCTLPVRACVQERAPTRTFLSQHTALNAVAALRSQAPALPLSWLNSWKESQRNGRSCEKWRT